MITEKEIVEILLRRFSYRYAGFITKEHPDFVNTAKAIMNKIKEGENPKTLTEFLGRKDK